MLLDEWKAQQIFMVLGEGWNSSKGRCFLFQRDGLEKNWNVSLESQANLGLKGMAWGRGLHKESFSPFIFKEEGDLRSPAGVFTLGAFFGYERINYTFPFLDLHQKVFAVDDANSDKYNQIIKDPEKISWRSAEEMHSIKEYEYGIVINHNAPQVIPFMGSAIFIHLENEKKKGTYGCTALDRLSLLSLMKIINFQKNPLFIQLPFETYKMVKEKWHLPHI